MRNFRLILAIGLLILIVSLLLAMVTIAAISLTGCTTTRKVQEKTVQTRDTFHVKHTKETIKEVDSILIGQLTSQFIRVEDLDDLKRMIIESKGSHRSDTLKLPSPEGGKLEIIVRDGKAQLIDKAPDSRISKKEHSITDEDIQRIKDSLVREKETEKQVTFFGYILEHLPIIICIGLILLALYKMGVFKLKSKEE